MKLRFLMASLMLTMMAAPNQAATYPVDDRGSHVRQPMVRTVWEKTAPTRDSSAVITGVMIVDVELNTAAWNGKSGKIYMTLAPTSASGLVRASWTVQSEVLLPGNLRSGERVVVYDGNITADRLRDTLTITLHADGNRVLRPEIINFTFEIDLP